MSYADIRNADHRLVLLKILADAPGCESNSSILQLAAQEFGHNVSRDQVHTQLAWLAEQDLITIRSIATVHVAVLTGRGLDVAHGRAVIPGVKRPGPGG